MGKNRIYSPYSVIKVEMAILGDIAGRLGGLHGLDRDIQLWLLQAARDRANYWRSKFGPYHELRIHVSRLLNRRDMSPAIRYLYYAFAQEVAKTYAMYPEDIAESLVDAYKRKYALTNADPDLINEIIDIARKIGKSITHLYHL